MTSIVSPEEQEIINEAVRKVSVFTLEQAHSISEVTGCKVTDVQLTHIKGTKNLYKLNLKLYGESLMAFDEIELKVS